MRKEPRFCKWDEKPIPDDKRIDAIYCSSQCGANCRNEKNREKEAVLKINDARRRINIIIIKDLMRKGIYEISEKSLEDYGFDFDCYDKIGEFDIAMGTEFFISTLSFTTKDKIVKFKKTR